MKPAGLFCCSVILWGRLAAAEPLYVEDFSKTEVGSMPEDVLVLDGLFGVKEEAGNRFAELPGAPLDSFGFLFGPNQPHGVEVSGRIHATKSGRRFPTFSLGLNGSSGYRLQLAPAKGLIELLRGDTVVTNAPFTWKSGEWTELRLAVRKVTETGFRIEGSAWMAGSAKPAEPLVIVEETKLQPPGKAAAWGMPFAGTPIRFDDLKVTPLGGS